MKIVLVFVILCLVACIHADCDYNAKAGCTNIYYSCNLEKKIADCICYGQLMKCNKRAGCLTNAAYKAIKEQCVQAQCTPAQCAEASSLLPLLTLSVAIAVIAMIAI